MTRMRLILTLAGALAMATPAAAQGRGKGTDTIPTAYRPPAGMCRIWLDNVPPAQQPAPTDCASAVRNRPSNGRVIFGEEPKDKSKRFKPRELRGKDRDGVWDRRPSARGGDDRSEEADRLATRSGDERDARDARGEDETGALPAMAGGALFVRGVRTQEVARWVGDDAVSARLVDSDSDGIPERVTWLDGRGGQVVQVWLDRDGDGRADRVELWRDGERTRVLGRS